MTSNEPSHTTKEKYVWGISINILLLGFVSLFTDIAGEIITTLMPLFIIVSLGGGALQVGLINGISDALANIIKGISGRISDKIKKRKAFVITGYAISTVSRPLIGIQTNWLAVLGLKMTDKIGKGIRVAPRDALISTYVDIAEKDHPNLGEQSGKSFGIHRSMDNLGAVIGPLIASALLFLGLTYGSIITVSLIPGIVAFILLFFIKDFKDESREQKIDGKVPFVKEKMEPLSKPLKKLILTLSVMEFASVDVAFIMLRAQDYFYTQSDALKWIPLLFASFNIVSTIFAPIAGRLLDKFGKQRIITIGLSVLWIVCATLLLPITASTTSLITIAIIFPIMGFYTAIVDTGSRAFISDITGKNKKGRIYGLYYFLVGMLSIPESLLFAWLYDSYGYFPAFLFSTISLTFCIIIFATADFSIKKKLNQNN
jgi:MFS family permease